MPRSPLFIDEIVSVRPTHDKALLENDTEMQPGFGGKAPVKHVQHPASKGLDAARTSIPLPVCACVLLAVLDCS
jgi:hypothetical protein